MAEDGKCHESGFLVRPHQPRIAGDISGEDRRQPPLDPLFAQSSLPAPRKPRQPAIAQASLCASGGNRSTVQQAGSGRTPSAVAASV